MSKPDDIPQDVWDSAIKCAETACRNLPDDYGDLAVEVTAIARAILAERMATGNRVKGMIADRLAEIAEFPPSDARTSAQNELRILQLKLSGRW